MEIRPQEGEGERLPRWEGREGGHEGGCSGGRLEREGGKGKGGQSGGVLWGRREKEVKVRRRSKCGCSGED